MLHRSQSLIQRHRRLLQKLLPLLIIHLPQNLQLLLTKRHNLQHLLRSETLNLPDLLAQSSPDPLQNDILRVITLIPLDSLQSRLKGGLVNLQRNPLSNPLQFPLSLKDDTIDQILLIFPLKLLGSLKKTLGPLLKMIPHLGLLLDQKPRNGLLLDPREILVEIKVFQLLL